VGEREVRGSSYQFLSSIILTAVSFEAYLNHVGASVSKSWKGLEPLSPSAKLDLLCELLRVDLPSDKGSRPRQTITELFNFRNALAHGRSETIQPKAEIVAADALDLHFSRPLRKQWERSIQNADFANRAREDAKAIMTLLHNASPEPKEGLLSFGAGMPRGCRSADADRRIWPRPDDGAYCDDASASSA
jgi:hypothetical protein